MPAQAAFSAVVLGCSYLSPVHGTDTCPRDRILVAEPTDCPLRVDFKEPLTEEQREWLLRTPLTLRRISFCPEDAASSTLLHRCGCGVRTASLRQRRGFALQVFARPDGSGGDLQHGQESSKG
jgi:hypothetical protein